MIRFILNERDVETDLPSGTTVLDYVRYHKNLTGTKIGCREGDCGACSILVGSMLNEKVQYRTVTSCLTALGSVRNKHVVTVEGLNLSGQLNKVQSAFQKHSATQCGFCTPGFVVAASALSLQESLPHYEQAVSAVDGNICRCTGYKSIQRALADISKELLTKADEVERLSFAIDSAFVPPYFAGIASRLKILTSAGSVTEKYSDVGLQKRLLGGGTDLYVQQHQGMVEALPEYVDARNSIQVEGGNCHISSDCTITALLESPFIQSAIPDSKTWGRLISSTAIRNMATVAGNFVNASPIGDLTIIFLALDARLVLSNGESRREVQLRQFYQGYKTLDKKTDEYILEIIFKVPRADRIFNFEKVSKRTNLDIASVNTAFCASLENEKLSEISVSAGGVGPVPLYLEKTSTFLTAMDPRNINETDLRAVLESEISPISDVRGSAEYKSSLLFNLIKAHLQKAC